jgi:NAD(P)-dependent dehydrogenase (short-subunit alcohol dehydrogenase family)
LQKKVLIPAIIYLNEHADAKKVRDGAKCLLIPGDISKESFCKKAVAKAIKIYGSIDILVNNAGIHYEGKILEDISTAQLQKTFATNVFPLFWITKEVLPCMKEGSSIVNTASVTAYRGSPELMDYAATKGAIVSFTRSLASNLLEKGIRVNAVAHGPIWTPLIVSSLDKNKVAALGSHSPMGRAGEPAEVAPAYLFLVCNDSSYTSGQVIHPNGGEIVNG